MSEQKPSLFVRDASGLTRALSSWDMFYMQIFIISPALMLGLSLYYGNYTFPNGDLGLATIISVAFACVGGISYTLMGASMPRTGGDYVWQSRFLSPAHAFTVVLPWVWYVGSSSWVPFVGWAWAFLILSPLLAVLGYLTGNPALSSAGTWLSTTNGVFVLAMILSLWILFVNLFGLKAYAKVQKVSFWVGMLSLLAIIGVALTATHQQFIGGFNAAMTNYFGATGDSYAKIMQNSPSGTVVTSGTDIVSTMQLMPFAAFAMIWVGWNTYVMGEVKGASKISTTFFYLVVGMIASLVIALVTIYSLYSIAGRDFYYAATAAFLNGTSPMPMPPFYAFLVGVAAGPVVLLFILITLNGWVFGYVPNLMLLPVRALFAMSFDRLLPEKMTELKTRYNIPIYAMLIVFISYILFSILYDYVPAFTSAWLAVGILGAWVQMTTVLAAAVWPYRRPDLFKDSPAAKYMIGKVPLIVISSAIYIAFSIFLLYIYLAGGAVYGVTVPSILFLIGLVLAHTAFFYIARHRRVKEGIPLDLVYKAIPVE